MKIKKNLHSLPDWTSPFSVFPGITSSRSSSSSNSSRIGNSVSAWLKLNNDCKKKEKRKKEWRFETLKHCRHTSVTTRPHTTRTLLHQEKFELKCDSTGHLGFPPRTSMLFIVFFQNEGGRQLLYVACTKIDCKRMIEKSKGKKNSDTYRNK